MLKKYKLKACKLYSFLLLALCVCSFSPAFAAGINYRLPTPDQWNLTVPKDDKVSVTMKDGVMDISFKVKTSQPYQFVYLSFQQSVIGMRLKTPVKLDKDIKRIFFEAKGLRTSARQGTVVLLMPVFRDGNGEILTYKPQSQQHLMNGSSNWAGWKTHSFYSTEAGGASGDSFVAVGGDGNSWPDGQLTFLGFDLVIRASEVIDYKGSVQLAGFAFGKYMVPYSDPYVYVDSLVKKPGHYKIASQIFRKYQDTPVREDVTEFDFDPAMPSQTGRKIFFKLGPDDNYWIRYQIIDGKGKIVASDSMRAWVENNKSAVVSSPVDLAAAPSIGYLRINPGDKNCGVFERGGKLVLAVRAFPKKLAGYDLKWRVEYFAYPEAIDKGEQKINFDGKKFIEVKVSPKTVSDCDAYRLVAEVVSNGKVLDSQEYVFGFKTDLSKPRTSRAGKRQTRDDVKKTAYVRMSYLSNKNGKRVKFKTQKQCLERFENALKQITQITTNITYMLDIGDFEVLPGVFDFFTLDKAMDLASEYGCRITMRLSHADHGYENLLRWQRYWPQRNSDGTINHGHRFYGSFSTADKKYVGNFLNAFKAFNDRYRVHPAFQGYQIFEIAGEWAVLDQPWNGSIVSYEQVARDSFIDYIKQNITADLHVLNKRWNTSYANWNQVAPPQPEYEIGAKPDMRLHWMDFCRFKHYLDSKYWVTTASKSIRTYDDECVIIVYNLDPGGFEGENGKALIDYLHNGGNHFLRGEGTLMNAWNKSRIGWITEPHHPHRWAAYGDKGNRGWLLDWTTYIMLAQAGAGGANMHVYFWPIPGKSDLFLPAHYGREYAYDRFEKWLPLLREMHGVQIKQDPPQIAVMQDIYTLFCKHRTIFEPRMDDLRRWFGLLKVDSLSYEDYRPECRKSYKLIIPNILDEVMSEDNIKEVKDLVKNGAKTVVSAMTGSLCPERQGETFVLLKELGIKPPIKPFVTGANGIKGKVVNESPFFAKGDAVPFYTLADLKNETQAPDMKKRFYQWPYRWLPQTDYFRIYPGHKVTDGKVIATFPDGGAAVSLHKHGKGEVLVFWGMPDYTPERMKGFMQKVADWAGVVNKRKGNPVPLTMEGNHAVLKRHYAIMYQDTPGDYRQKLPEVPKGTYFIDDLVTGQRFGVFKSEELRNGVTWTWYKGMSPLKVLRMIPVKEMGSRWTKEYRMPK